MPEKQKKARKKRCTYCRQMKALDQFTKSQQSKDGFSWQCKECRNARRRGLYLADPEKHCARAKDYRKRHHEHWIQWRRAYNSANADRLKRASREYYVTHRKEILKKQSQYRKEHRDKGNIYQNQYRTLHPEARKRYWRAHPDEYRVAHRRRRAQQCGVNEHFTKTMEAFVFSFWNNECALCGGEIRLCVDHWLPLSKGYALAMDNAVLLCTACNVRKKDKMPASFLEEITLAHMNRRLKRQMRKWKTYCRARAQDKQA